MDVAWDAFIDEGWVGFEAAKARHRPAIEAEARIEGRASGVDYQRAIEAAPCSQCAAWHDIGHRFLATSGSRDALEEPTP